MLPTDIREALATIRTYIRDGDASEADYAVLGSTLEDLAEYAYDPFADFDDDDDDDEDTPDTDDTDLAAVSTDEYRKGD